MNMNVFAQKLFAASTLLAPLRAKRSEWFDEFRSYKGQIPVCGCILLNPAQDKLVLVRNWKGTSWTFPKGKLNEGEPGAACAVREVLEETGFDADRHASDHPGTAASDEAMLETFFGDQRWCVAALASRARARAPSPAEGALLCLTWPFGGPRARAALLLPAAVSLAQKATVHHPRRARGLCVRAARPQGDLQGGVVPTRRQRAAEEPLGRREVSRPAAPLDQALTQEAPLWIQR